MSTPGNHHTIIIDECPSCRGEGRQLGAPSKWGDGSPTDFGPCRECNGTGEVEAEFECRTLDDLENEAAERPHMCDCGAECQDVGGGRCRYEVLTDAQLAQVEDTIAVFKERNDPRRWRAMIDAPRDGTPILVSFRPECAGQERWQMVVSWWDGGREPFRWKPPMDGRPVNEGMALGWKPLDPHPHGYGGAGANSSEPSPKSGVTERVE